MTNPRSLALLGGPNSGKSTYLGAVIDALESHSLQRLRPGSMPGDARALRQLSEPLLDGHYPQRTKRAQNTTLELPLRTTGDPLPSLDFTLRVGDYAGEEVEALFNERTRGWSEEWQARAHADAILLFVRPDAFTPLPTLRQHGTLETAGRWDALRSGDPA